jgi:hypothetical protein
MLISGKASGKQNKHSTFKFIAFFWVSDPLCLSYSSALRFFRLFLFGSTTLLTGMTGISLHMQWPLTSQLHGSVFQREQLVKIIAFVMSRVARWHGLTPKPPILCHFKKPWNGKF